MPFRRTVQVKVERNNDIQPPATRSRLLALPAELANEIYTMVLGDAVIHLLPRRIRENELFSEDRDSDESSSSSTTSHCRRRRAGRRSNYICDHKAPADANIVPSHPVCECLTHCCAVTSMEHVHLALLYTCRETYNAASRILYGTNAFFISVSRAGSLDRRGHYFQAEPAITQVYHFVIALRPASLAMLRYLHIDHLTPNRVNFGLVIPYANWGPSEMNDTMEFQLGLEFLCDVIGDGSLPCLRILGLGIKFPSLKDWKGGLKGVDWVQPLLEMCQRPPPSNVNGQPRLKIVLTPKNRFTPYARYMGVGKKVFCFLDRLSGEMDDRRVEQGWMPGEGVKVVYRLVLDDDVDDDDDDEEEGVSESEDGSDESDDLGDVSSGETEIASNDGTSVENDDGDDEMTDGIENDEGNDDGNCTIVDENIKSMEDTPMVDDGNQPGDATKVQPSLEGSHVGRGSDLGTRECEENVRKDGI